MDLLGTDLDSDEELFLFTNSRKNKHLKYYLGLAYKGNRKYELRYFNKLIQQDELSIPVEVTKENARMVLDIALHNNYLKVNDQLHILSNSTVPYHKLYYNYLRQNLNAKENFS